MNATKAMTAARVKGAAMQAMNAKAAVPVKGIAMKAMKAKTAAHVKGAAMKRYAGLSEGRRVLTPCASPTLMCALITPLFRQYHI